MLFDLNCDLGEGAGNDRLIMPYITSANIACGGHAGTRETMRETAELAIEYGVKIGAHPGYPDPGNFGRVSMKMSRADLLASVMRQILDLKMVVAELGGKLAHVKPHGALYNDAAADPEIAAILADAVFTVDPALTFMGLSGSVMIDIARERGLKTVREVFADRNYTDEGQLVARSQPEALITDIAQSLEHVRRMITKGELRTQSGKVLPIGADTVCLHGDQPLSPELARVLYLTGFQNLSGIGFQNLSGIKPLGSTSFLLSFGNTISPAINRKVHAFSRMLMNADIPGLIEVIPAYSDLTIIFNPDSVNWAEFLKTIKDHVSHFATGKISESTDIKEVIDMPVFYGGDMGPDLEEVAGHSGLPVEEVIRRHSEGEYTVFMMGFTPGFCYLGGLDPALNTPRRTEPRLKVPAGSVGIAGNQTGIYPIESPGGWQIIGRTTTGLFEPASEQPFMCRAGDRIRFRRAEDDGRPMTEDLREVKRVLPPVIGHPSSVISVLEPGFLTTVQDAGRFGYRAFGMPVSGAMDLQSMRFANSLVGNDPDEAVLEITFMGPVLEFHADSTIALAGAEMRPLVNGSERSNGERIEMRAGDRLSFAGLRSGLRTYLSIKGGFDVPTIMGSKSTYLRGRVGGVEGRALIGGDELYIGHKGTGAQGHKGTGAQGHIKGSGPYARISFIPGPEADRFTIKGLSTFLGSEFTVSPNSDRMGMRLEGPSVEHTDGPDILSSGVIPGTIQVPGDGKPIILLNDCQTTGGYTRIGCVIIEDLPILAQLKPGDKVRFFQTALNRKS